jgi:hypothetical protein
MRRCILALVLLSLAACGSGSASSRTVLTWSGNNFFNHATVTLGQNNWTAEASCDPAVNGFSFGLTELNSSAYILGPVVVPCDGQPHNIPGHGTGTYDVIAVAVNAYPWKIVITEP